jgi:hypothetical protein
MKDVEMGLGAAERKVRRGRKNLRRKVKASGVKLDDHPRYDIRDDEEDAVEGVFDDSEEE